MADVVDAGDARAEGLPVRPDAAHRHAAEVDAVVAALAADQPEALALAAGTVVGKRDLEGRIGRLGAGIGEEDARVALGRNLRKPLGELKGDRVAHLERGREVELRRLLADRLDDPRPAVAGVDAPEAGLTIEDLAALRGPVVHPLGTREQARRLL